MASRCALRQSSGTSTGQSRAPARHEYGTRRPGPERRRQLTTVSRPLRPSCPRDDQRPFQSRRYFLPHPWKRHRRNHQAEPRRETHAEPCGYYAWGGLQRAPPRWTRPLDEDLDDYLVDVDLIVDLVVDGDGDVNASAPAHRVREHDPLGGLSSSPPVTNKVFQRSYEPRYFMGRTEVVSGFGRRSKTMASHSLCSEKNWAVVKNPQSRGTRGPCAKIAAPWRYLWLTIESGLEPARGAKGARQPAAAPRVCSLGRLDAELVNTASIRHASSRLAC